MGQLRNFASIVQDYVNHLMIPLIVNTSRTQPQHHVWDFLNRLLCQWRSPRHCRSFLQSLHLNALSSNKPLDNGLLVYIHTDSLSSLVLLLKLEDA
jgi:hypothetical protein